MFTILEHRKKGVLNLLYPSCFIEIMPPSHKLGVLYKRIFWRSLEQVCLTRITNSQ